MSHRQYLKKFDPLVQFPPATYCPANGMVNPNDPVALGNACTVGGYFKDPTTTEPDWYQIPDPSADQIELVYSDLKEKQIYVNCQVNTGTWMVWVYGNNGTLLAQSSALASGASYTYNLTVGQGISCALGYTTYRVKISPTASNHITKFQGYYQILQAKFNTPYITNLTSAFYNIKSLVKVDFQSDMNALTTLYQSFYQTTSLSSVTFKNMTALTSLYQTFYYSGVRRVTFPTDLPQLTTLESAFYYANRIEEINYPTMDKLTTMLTTHQNNTSLLRVYLPSSVPVLAGMRQTFTGCSQLKYVSSFTYAPLLADMYQTFNNTVLNYYSFPATMPALSNMTMTFYGNIYLKTVTMPTSAASLSILTSTFSGCNSLESTSIPSNATSITDMNSTFMNCFNLNVNISLPATMNSCTTWYQTFYYCSVMPSVTLPGSATAITTAYKMFYYCARITSLTFPATMNSCTTMESLCEGDTSITSITFPTSANALTTLFKALMECPNISNIALPNSLPALTTWANFIYLSTQIATPLTISSCTFGTNQVDCGVWNRGHLGLSSIYFPTLRVTQFSNIPSGAVSELMSTTSVEINWANSSYSGTQSNTLELTYGKLTVAELNRIFTALPTVTGTKKIRIVGNTGTAGCTPSIATAKGWIVLTT